MRDDLRGVPALNAAQESLIHITIPVGMLQCNCSIIGDPVTHEALVVDPGDEVTRILELLGRRRLTVKAIVSTHAHIDHVGGLSKLHQYTGAPVLMHRDDLPLYQAMEMQAAFLGVLPPDLAEVDQLLKEGDILRWGSLEAQVIHTPGHTPGSVSLYLPHDAGKISLTDQDAKNGATANAGAGPGAAPASQSDDSRKSDAQRPSSVSEMGGSEKPGIRVPQLLAGDTLFAGSIGRTDLWGGSMEEIMDSLRGKLMQLPDLTIVHPGHGPMTTIGRERETNPFLQPE
jgi:glyoxylase-like metal-dependent hydrolase (beta-lactamase superfamily II)